MKRKNYNLTKRQCCELVFSFTFRDGKKIEMCPVHSVRTNHLYPELNSTRAMDIKRSAVLCGGTR